VKFTTEDLAALRSKLTFHINGINVFIASLSAGSLARIEGVLDELVRDIKAGKKEPSVISAHDEPMRLHGANLKGSSLVTESPNRMSRNTRKISRST
jgi:hypothetical protein